MSDRKNVRRDFIKASEIATDGGHVITPSLSGTITVCHRRNEQVDTYGGRSRRGDTLAHMMNTEPPATGWLGNPFAIEKDASDQLAERRRVIARYLCEFLDRISRDEDFEAAVEGLRGQRVACWCHGPSTKVTEENVCHLDVVKAYLDDDLTPVYSYLRGEEFNL